MFLCIESTDDLNISRQGAKSIWSRSAVLVRESLRWKPPLPSSSRPTSAASSSGHKLDLRINDAGGLDVDNFWTR
jgi:hypothetical protein